MLVVTVKLNQKIVVAVLKARLVVEVKTAQKITGVVCE